MTVPDVTELKRQAIERAKLDETFRQELIADPRAAIEKMSGQILPPDFSFDVKAELGALADIDPDDLGLGHGKM